MSPKHPAPFNKKLLPEIQKLLRSQVGDEKLRILDPYAGEGRIHILHDDYGHDTVGIDISPEWAEQHPRTKVGNILKLRYRKGSFGAVITSPCLEVNEKVLTADLRWVRAGDVQEGDRLLAFDEFGPGKTARGTASRRRWRIAQVTQAGTARKQCVRVTLENGDSVVCSWDHPWLANRYRDNSAKAEWVRACDLMGSPARGYGRGHTKGLRQPHFVYKQLTPWEDDRSYEAGWLAGMFDGEGSLSFGEHGSPQLIISQNIGEVAQQAEAWLLDLGFKVNVIGRSENTKMVNIYVTDGFRGVLTALGRLRPTRLLKKIDQLDVASRTVQADKIQVVAVEDVGEQEIATITTSTGTYIGQGYLHHNTYANRLADSHEAKDKCKHCGGEGCKECNGSGLSRRNSYRHRLGRPLEADDSSGMQWGDAYRVHHEHAWAKVHAILPEGGLFILNCKNHIRGGVEQKVTEWHIKTIKLLGFTVVKKKFVKTPSMRDGQNHTARLDGEWLILFKKVM